VRKKKTRKGFGPSYYVRVDGDIAYVELTRGKVAIIDAADAEAVGRYF
jgi:hypothetical protein